MCLLLCVPDGWSVGLLLLQKQYHSKKTAHSSIISASNALQWLKALNLQLALNFTNIIPNKNDCGPITLILHDIMHVLLNVVDMLCTSLY